MWQHGNTSPGITAATLLITAGLGVLAYLEKMKGLDIPWWGWAGAVIGAIALFALGGWVDEKTRWPRP